MDFIVLNKINYLLLYIYIMMTNGRFKGLNEIVCSKMCVCFEDLGKLHIFQNNSSRTTRSQKAHWTLFRVQNHVTTLMFHFFRFGSSWKARKMTACFSKVYR